MKKRWIEEDFVYFLMQEVGDESAVHTVGDCDEGHTGINRDPGSRLEVGFASGFT